MSTPRPLRGEVAVERAGAKMKHQNRSGSRDVYIGLFSSACFALPAGDTSLFYLLPSRGPCRPRHLVPPAAPEIASNLSESRC